MSGQAFTLRAYAAADEDAAIELWRRTWTKHYPHIDFNSRVAWWRERWRHELVPVAHIAVSEQNGTLIGFIRSVAIVPSRIFSRIRRVPSTSKISEEQLFYLMQRGISQEDAVSLIINGFCKDVFLQLPMEFAVEATRLLGLKLEGAVA